MIALLMIALPAFAPRFVVTGQVLAAVWMTTGCHAGPVCRLGASCHAPPRLTLRPVGQVSASQPLALSLAKVKAEGSGQGSYFCCPIEPADLNRGPGHHRGHDSSRGNAGRLASRPDRGPRPRADVPNGS